MFEKLDNLIAYFSALPEPYNYIAVTTIIILVVASLFKLVFGAFSVKK